MTGKVTFGRTKLVQSGPSQSPFTETEVRLNGTAVGRIISRANPKLSGLLEEALGLAGVSGPGRRRAGHGGDHAGECAGAGPRPPG